MRKILLCAMLLALLSFVMVGCDSKAETPVVPYGQASSANVASSDNYELTSADALASLAVGETAVWQDYEVTVSSIERADDQLVVDLVVKSHKGSLSLDEGCLLSFGMESVGSTFLGGVIEIPAGGEAVGSLTFDDQYHSQVLFWNDGAIEAKWFLDKPAASSEGLTSGQNSNSSSSVSASGWNQTRVQAVETIENSLPGLFSEWTYYVFQSVDTSTAEVESVDSGGYRYSNEVSILDGNGQPTMTHIETQWSATGECISFTLEGVEVI